MKNNLINILWFSSKQIMREHFYSLAQFLLSIVFSISMFVKLYYFNLPDVSPEVRMKLSGDVLSTTLTVMMLFSVIVYILISLIYNKHRTKTFGVMRGVGARRGFVFLLLLMENFIILITSTLIGLIFSIIFSTPGARYLERMYSVSVVSNFSDTLIAVAFTLLAVIALGIITAVLTSSKIIFGDPYEIIRSRE